VADVDQLTFSSAPVDCVLRVFTPVTEADVVALVQSLPDKQCASNPLPTWLLNSNVEVLAPFLCRLYSWSLEHDIVLSTFKSAYITPTLKKADLNAADSGFYRPILNLSVISKLLECLVAKLLVKFLSDNNLLPDLQLACRAYHSTKTAVLKVVPDIVSMLDSGDPATLVLIDLSVASLGAPKSS